jgi:LuxR family maltose regulon positive regulatory protein
VSPHIGQKADLKVHRDSPLPKAWRVPYDESMYTPVLVTKLYIPPLQVNVVPRPGLIERLIEGLHRKLTLISAPAGFGKTTLVSEWIAGCEKPVAWLSLDEADNDPIRFLIYLVAALQTVATNLGAGALGVLQSPQPPSTESILTSLINEITGLSDDIVLVLDDYHMIDAKSVDLALSFLLEHMPPQLHLILTTREDPQLPLARLRARGQMTELRAADLRFTADEAAEFLNPVMGLNLAAQDVVALEERTEGWIAGLQLAAISMRGHKDTTRFIQSFTGSHHFVLDYLVEEVLHQQSASVQTFLLRTSILDRLCGSLCDAVLHDPSVSGQETLEYIERANLFLVPLDNERRWYRYHHLFAELLRQRLQQSMVASTAGVPLENAGRNAEGFPFEYHIRASVWYEQNGLGIEAFQHAVAANDVARAARLIEGDGMPLHFRGAVTAILGWLESLPVTEMNAMPSLWWRYGSMLLVIGQTTGVEEKLQAAEDALEGTEADDTTRNLIGRIATARAVLALTRYQPETIISQSRRALDNLHPDNLPLRANVHWTLGFAYLLQGDRAAASCAYTEAISLNQASGDTFTTILAMGGLGQVQEADNQLYLAVETYRRVLQLAGDRPLPILSGSHLGLARVFYEWNDLEAAERHGRQSLHLAMQFESVIDRFVVSEVFLSRLKLAQGDIAGAAAMLAQSSQSARQRNFVHRMPEVAAAQVLTLLHQGDLAAAAHLAQAHDLPLSQARVHLAQRDPATALAMLEPLRQQAEAKGWQDEWLKVMVLQALALQVHGEKNTAVQLLADALALAEPGGFIRLFVDEGLPMKQLLSEAAAYGVMSNYTGKLLAAFEAEAPTSEGIPSIPPGKPAQSLIEQLSHRELEVLHLIAQGLSNNEIGERLYLALSTVKGHNRMIFEKLQVQRRTEAVARARELGLL